MRPLATALLALAVTLPSYGSHPHGPPSWTDQVYADLLTIEHLAQEVRHPHLRRDLQRHARSAQQALERGATVDSRRQRSRSSRAPDTCPTRSNLLTYADAHEMVSRERFDSGRLGAIERIGRSACLTTEEARSLASLLTFDSGKEKALVALFPAVVDPPRYALALDVLTFSSARDRVASQLGI